MYKTDAFLAGDLADWAWHLKYEHLSSEAIERAKLFWYDSLGCALGGSRQEDAEILLAHHRAMHPADSGPCTLFVSGQKTNPVDATFLNSHMIRVLDYNDIYWKADPVHPSDLIAGPLALCEYANLSGRDLILGTVIAYEIEMRFAECGRPGIREYGWHHATWTGFAAPIAAGRILGLTPKQIVHAVGCSASRTGSLGAVTAGRLTHMKNTVDPWASRCGVESALWAARDYRGPEHILDGKEGLFHVFAHASCDGKLCQFDTDILTADLPKSPSDTYRILACGMKSYPMEALCHAPLTALMKCVAQYNIRSEDVAEIQVEVIARAADILGDPSKYRPTSKETADHSLPYALAVGLVDGMVTPLQFQQSRIDDPTLPAVMDKVRVFANREFESLFPEFQPSRVTLILQDGTRYSKRVDVPKGDPRDPMTPEEIGVKFRAIGSDILGEEQCRSIGEKILQIEREPTVDDLVQLMTCQESATDPHIS
ncbi:MAG: MmgE/PrpD family protein [Pirellulales bacterium]|nr:MmgE/PrpD family protein [Pirellulales bacterium]